MKIILATFISFAALSSLFGQGALTPPGAPAPMMKTLSQIEPRIAITNSGAVTISQSGSYYLTTNIAVTSGNAIAITASGVTLDLNGFTVSSTASPSGGSGVATAANDLSDITILNGHIRGGVTNNGSGVYSGPGFQTGVGAAGTTPTNVRISGLSVSGCGNGISIGGGIAASSALVENCTVKTVSSVGITSERVSGCTAIDCGSSAIYAYVATDCRGQSSSGGFGIHADLAENCHGISNTGDAVYGTVLQNCYGISTNAYGIHAAQTAEHCYGRSISGTGGVNAQNAIFCTGSRTGGAANSGYMATGCMAESGTNNFIFKYNMP